MAAPSTTTSTLSQQEIKTLEQTRQRLFQLSNSLASLQHNILQADPLPSWTSLQSLASIISQNLSSVSAHLATHAPLLSSMAVFPLETYPGKTQEGLLGQLLRKKLEPEVEDWVARGRRAAEEAGMGDTDRREKTEELWNWAGLAANELARGHEWGGEFTRDEREGGVENVVTGLRKRRMGGDEEEGEEGDEEEDEEEEEGDEDRDEEDKMEIIMQTQTDDNNNNNNKKAVEGGDSKMSTTEQEQDGKAETTAESKNPLPLPPPQPPLSLEETLKFLVTGIGPRR